MAQAFFNSAGRILVLGGVNLTGLYLNVSSIFSTFAFSLFEIAMLWARQEVLSLDESIKKQIGAKDWLRRNLVTLVVISLINFYSLTVFNAAIWPAIHVPGIPEPASAVEVLPACWVLHGDPLPGGHRRRARAFRARVDDDDGQQAHAAGARRPRRPGAATDPRDDCPRRTARPAGRRHQLARDGPADRPAIARPGGQGGCDGGGAHERGGDGWRHRAPGSHLQPLRTSAPTGRRRSHCVSRRGRTTRTRTTTTRSPRDATTPSGSRPDWRRRDEMVRR